MHIARATAVAILLIAGCDRRDLAKENTQACLVATSAEVTHLADCVDAPLSEDCDAQHASDACDWVVHYTCREYAANAVEDCHAPGAVEAWEEEVAGCPPADCTPYGQDRPFFTDE